LDFNVDHIRRDFPILEEKVYGKPLVYLDNAATTQKPIQVIETISNFYKKTNSNIHRGVHYLSGLATDQYELSRKTIANFIGAKNPSEIVFTAGATASINTVAYSFGIKYLQEGDEILLTAMEHHANIVPWQIIAELKKATIKVIPINDHGELELDNLENLISTKTKIISVTQVSNSLGTVNRITEIIQVAHKYNIPVLIDGSQSVQHFPINVSELDCDFFVFSGHKIYGPTGIGVLYGKEKWLEQLPPYQGGGDMIKHVSFEKTTYNDLPFKFEAGTTNYVGAIALASAIDYLRKIGMDNIRQYEHELFIYASQKLNQIENLITIGTAVNKIGVISFIINGLHQYDVGMILDKMGVAVRTGTHCTEPVMTRFGIDGTVRASFAFYNTFAEIDQLEQSLKKVAVMFN
jgi:cysteine desulfurase / selenocysteine lyase